MKNMFFVSLLLLGVLLPTAAFSDGEILNQPRPEQIKYLAEKIMVADFKPLNLTVETATEREAIVAIAEATRNYLKTCNVCCLLSACLGTVEIPTNGEYYLVKQWQDQFTVSKQADGTVRVTFTVSTKQLKQVALCNMWPLYYKSFPA